MCPAIRASEIPELSKTQLPYPTLDYGEEWLARCSADFKSVFSSSIDGYLVIAEEAQVKGPTWELPE